jgi:predicted PurR-regulated permease PerM
MTETQRSVLSACFSLAIILFALFVTQRFVLPLLWAAILCIATWPLYRRALRMLGNREILAAALVTVLAALVFITPLVLGVASAAHQAPALAQLVASANTDGLAAPAWLLRIPMAGDAIHNWWQATLGQPHGLAHLLQDGSVGRMQIRQRSAQAGRQRGPAPPDRHRLRLSCACSSSTRTAWRCRARLPPSAPT